MKNNFDWKKWPTIQNPNARPFENRTKMAAHSKTEHHWTTWTQNTFGFRAPTVINNSIENGVKNREALNTRNIRIAHFYLSGICKKDASEF